MAKIQSTNTMIGPANIPLDLNRPVSNIGESISKTLSATIEAYAPKANLGEVLSQHVSAYNQRMTDLENSGEISNTAISNLNRATKSSLTQSLLKAGADSKTINSYMESMKEIFESDSRFEYVDKGTYGLINSHGDKPRVVVNNPELVAERAAMDMIASLPEAVQSRYHKMSPEAQKKFNEHLEDKSTNLSILKISAAVSEAESKIQGVNDARAKARANRIYNMALTNTIAPDLMERSTELLGQVVAGDISPAEAASIMQEYKDDYYADETLRGLGQHLDITNKLNTDLAPFMLTEDQFQALGTDLDNLDNLHAGQKLAIDIATQRTRLNLPPNVKQMINISEILGENLMHFRMISKLSDDVEGGEAIQWQISKNGVMRDTIIPNMNVLSGQQEVTPEVEASGMAVRSAMINSMQAYVKLDPYSAKMGAEEILSVYDAFIKTNYYNNLPNDYKAKLQLQYKAFLKTLQEYTPEFKQRYDKLSDKDKGGFFSWLTD